MDPCSAAINRFIYTIAGGEVGTNVGLAGSGINGFGVGRRNGERANRGDGLAIKNGRPNHTGIGRLPDAAANRAEIKGGRIAGHSGYGYYSSATEGPNQPPLKSVK